MGAAQSAKAHVNPKDKKNGDGRGETNSGGERETDSRKVSAEQKPKTRPVERRYSNVWAIRNRTRVLRSNSVRDLESSWKNEKGFFEEVLLTSPHQRPELIPRAKLRQRTLLTEIFRDPISEDEWLSRLNVKGDKMIETLPQKKTEEKGTPTTQDQDKQINVRESTIPSEQKNRPSKYSIYGQTLRPFGKDYRQMVENCGIATIESESNHSSDTDFSTYITCCSECDKSDDLSNQHRQEDRIAMTQDNNNNIKQDSCTTKKDDSGDFKSDKADSNDDMLYEAMNFQIQTDVQESPRKFETEETTLKIQETKENVKAITTIHIIHSPELDSDPEEGGNVSKKKRLFTQNKKTTGNKYRKLFYELPETSTKSQYAEEEYVYEPKFRTTTTKLVMKTRSLVNLNDPDPESDHTYTPMSKRDFGELLPRPKSESDLISMRESHRTLEKCLSRMCSNATERFEETKKDEESDAVKDTDQLKDKSVGRLPLINSAKKKENDSGTNKSEDVKTIKENQTKEKQNQCRITGATFKNPSQAQTDEKFIWNTCPRRDRFCFYYPRKRNREIIDDELPDPDKVKDIREKFEQTIQTGSTENMSTIAHVQKSNQLNRIQSNTWSSAYRKHTEIRCIEISDAKPPKKENGHSRLIDSPKFKYWTDTTSVSSGVASDFSCETDSDLSPRNEGSDLFQMPQDVENSGQPVSAETMRKIRACGTSTTYYGGRVISCDKGTVRSPMTMTIMDEIRQNIKENDVNLQMGIKSLQNKYCGMKFRLVKSNSCGSRLELTGTKTEPNRKGQRQLESVNENDIKVNITGKHKTVVNICSEERTEEAGVPSGWRESNKELKTQQEVQQITDREELTVSKEYGHRGHRGHTRNIVRVFESTCGQKDETQSTPWKTLIESRRQMNRLTRPPRYDEMEFEEFEVLEDPSPAVKNDTPIIIEQNS